MKFKNKLGFLSIFLFILIISSGIVFAEDSALPSVENGEVSGNVDIATVNPFSTKNTSAELEYEIPASASEIQSAYVVVSTYSGSGNYTYGLTTNISLRTASTTEVLEYANLTFVNDTANDPVVYPITDLTSKQYSDYQSLINITDKVKGLSSGDTVTISVNNTELEGYIFDGRIKLIALVFAYNDNDNDKISYWLNIGQAWTKGTLTTVFKTKDFDGEYEDVALESVSLSSTDANYTLNGIELSDPIQRKGSNFIYDKWDVTDIFEMGNDTSLACTNTGKYSYKAVIQLLTVYNPEVHYIAADIKTEYTSTPSVYAGVNNTLTVKVNNYNKNFNGSVKLYIGDEELDSVDVAINAYNSTSITLVDPTIRPVTANTVNGNNNEKVNYTVVIEDADGFVLNETDASIVLVYDGYLGKDFEYPGANPLEREFYITGDVIVLNTEDYSAAGATSRNDTYNVDLDGGVVNTALLYVSYNWDKIVGDDYNTWNTTFNGVAIAPIATYRDQSNLGGLYAKYGYGLVVYNVTELVVDGNNTFALEKISGNAAVYPSNLIVLTDKKVSAVESYVYIWEEADLLSKSYNKFVPAGFNSTFDTVDGNATLYVFAASAQPGEGNIIVNNETYTNVWNGTSNSFDTFTTEVDAEDISVYFEATGATILGLHQMVVVENPRIAVDSALKTEYTSVPTIYAGVNNTLTVTVTNNGAEIENLTVYVLLDGEEFANYTIDSLAAGASDVNNVVDLTIRPITANTVNGNDNEKVNYIVGIRGADGKIIDLANYSFVVVYDGYLGKDFEYPNAEPLLREFFITGDVIVLNTKDYSAGGATNRTDVYEIDLNDGIVNTALLYVSYNWDKVLDDDYNSWNTTFNGVAIVPIASYRDQSNLGGASAKYGYGLVVYDVTELVVDGNNTFALEKISGMSAVYPSNLIVLTDKDASAVESTVYIWEEADLLSKSYNKFVPAGFNSNFTVIDGNATLFVFAASAQAGEGNIIVNNETYENVWSGSSYSFDIFSTDVNGTDISVYFEATGSTILGLHQMVVVENPRIAMSSDMKSEYTSVPSVYAGVNNTFALTVNNDGADVENVTVYVLEGQNLVGNFTIDSMLSGDKEVFTVVDPTIWPITENTVNGNDNEIANYTVVIMDADGNIIDLANYSFVVVYDGYLGKDFEYPNALSLLWEITFTGDAIVLKTDAYSAGAATNRTDVYEVDLANGTVNRALLYVSYNWDKALDGDYKTWNATFNGVAITPIEAFRDQSNLGGASAKYGYGLVVYDVSELVVDGNNTFAFEKIKGNSAVYPSNLIVLTDKNNSAYKTAYIIEEADLLSKSYNKYVPAGFETSFEIVEGNATLYVFAASAQAGEGNIIVNNETYENVWNGSSYSFDTFTVPVNGTDINVYFEATGSTILGLHQMIIVEHENYLVIEAPDVTKYYKGSERFVVTVTDCVGTPVANKTVSITINGVTYNRTTDEKGIASMALGLNSGEYNVTAAVDNNTVDSIVTILPTVNGTDVVKVFRNGTQYYATFLDSEGNYLKDGTTVNFNINGVMYERKVSGNYGMARLNINLEQGTYIITAINPVTGENAANNITVLPNIVNNTDLVKYYRNDSQYYVTIIGDDGNPVGANETVIFNINGVMYERKTNENGTARLNINLQPGDYIITAMYNGCNVANNITVLPVLSAQDVTMTYKDGTQFKANLLDGQGKPLADTNVTFNINGVFYNRATDANGVAALNINLMPGEYIITSSYNGTNIANTIKING